MNAIISSINTTACNAVLANAKTYGGRKIAQIPLELLELAPYQRKRGNTVAAIAREWDDRKCDPLTVSFRNGAFYVVDGQHRLAAAKLIGKTDITCVISEMNYYEEACYFAQQKDNVLNMSMYSRLWAMKEAGDPSAIDIFRIFDEADVPLIEGRRRESGQCCTAGQAARIYNGYGRDALIAILETIETVGWKHTHGGYSSTSLSSMKNLWRKTKALDKMLERADTVIHGRSFDMVLAEAHAQFPGRGSTSALSELLINFPG